MAGRNDESHENDIYAEYSGEVSQAELGQLQATPNWAQQEPQGDSSYTNEVMRRADTFVRQQQAQEQGLAPQPGAATPDRQNGLAQAHQQTEQARDTRAHVQQQGERTSLSRMQADGVQQNEAAAAAALHRDQARDAVDKGRNQRQTEQTGKQDQKQQQQAKEKQHDKGQTRGR